MKYTYFILAGALIVLSSCTVITYEETRNPEFHFHAEGQDSKIDTRIEGVDVATKRETGQKGESKSAIDADTALSQAGSTLAKTLGDVIMDGVSSKLDQAKTDSDNTQVTPKPVVTPTDLKPDVKPTDPNIKQGDDIVHHINTKSWEGKGTSIVLKEGYQLETATIGGRVLTKHPSLDKNREVWTLYTTPGKTGPVYLEEKNGAIWTFTYPKPVDTDITNITDTRIRWKPVADSGGNLVVLTPKGWPKVVTKVVYDNKEDIGRNVGKTNGDRQTYRFSKPGVGYSNFSTLVQGNKKYLVPDPSIDYGR